MVAVMYLLLGHRAPLVVERHDPIGGHSAQNPLPATTEAQKLNDPRLGAVG
jgi:hypothetical protein